MTRNTTPWTDEERQYLRHNYLLQPLRVLAPALNRSPSAVWKELRRLGLNKRNRETLRYERVEIRFTAAEYIKLSEEAERRGIPLANTIRFLALRYLHEQNNCGMSNGSNETRRRRESTQTRSGT